MNKQNYNELQKCCSCGKEVETDDHLFQCAKRPGFQNKIRSALGRLKNGMCRTLYKVFEYCVLDFIVPKLNNWWTLGRFFWRHPTISNIPHYKEYTELLLQQQKISWDNILRGKLSLLWRKYQDQYEKEQCFRKQQCTQNPYIKITPRKKTNRF